jgi:hypothetical protein
VGIRVRSFVLALLLFVPAALVPASGRFSGDDSAKGEERFDGPAELPRVHVLSALADTPAHGQVREVHVGDDLQKAIDSSKCGETLALEAGATFRGVFRLPAKKCDDSHWIVLRTSALDSSLPPAGTRVTPCYAGVASLPGRPDFHCASPHNVLATISFDGSGNSGPIMLLPGANHYRLIGLEVTRTKPQLHMQHLIAPDNAGSPWHHIVFDRLWVHGTAQDETKDGVNLNGATNVAIVDSYFTDLHCIAGGGSCTDAQAVSGGGGNIPSGPYKIENNFLEASGENILLGGAPGDVTPADIEIRRNHFFKPLVWKPDQPGFVGSESGRPYIVKNLFELKNAQRVLLEGNILENCWGGFTQAGFAVLLTPSNQAGKCPSCQVSDVTIRYNKISHVAGVLQVATALSPREKAASSGGRRFSIHDLIVDDIDGQAYKGFGVFMLMVSAQPPLRSVRIDHVTAFPPKTLISILNGGSKIEDFTVTNSLFNAGMRQLISAGGGMANCTRPRDAPIDVLNNCFANATFTHNLIIGGRKKWPAGNIVVEDSVAAGIRDFHDERSGIYRLCAEDGTKGCKKRSSGLKAGTDGKDLGADVDAVEAATLGVE